MLRGLFRNLFFVVVEWSLLGGAERWEREGNNTPSTAKIYMLWANGLEYETKTGYRLQQLSLAVMAQMELQSR